jgi:hypothetical protein
VLDGCQIIASDSSKCYWPLRKMEVVQSCYFALQPVPYSTNVIWKSHLISGRSSADFRRRGDLQGRGPAGWLELLGSRPLPCIAVNGNFVIEDRCRVMQISIPNTNGAVVLAKRRLGRKVKRQPYEVPYLDSILGQAFSEHPQFSLLTTNPLQRAPGP